MADSRVLEAPLANVGVTARQRSLAMWLLLAIYTVNFVDRQILNILAEPIKRDLALADWQLGLLTGFAFAVFYTVLGVPLARLADRADRVTIISISLAAWSLFTAACGMAQNFAQLLLLRIGVGVGEAGCTPTAHSLISDYTPKARRASALAFYSMGVPIGSMAGLAIGGLISDSFGWRAALIAVGLPGVILAVVSAFVLKEPRRGQVIQLDAPPAARFSEVLRELRTKPSFWWAALGAALTSFVSYGHVAFYGSFFFRNHAEGLERLTAQISALTGWSMGPGGLVGAGLGLTVGLSGVIGSWLGGVAADRAGARDPGAYMTPPALASLIGVPFVVLAVFAGSPLAALAFLSAPLLVKTMWYGPVYACAQGVVAPSSRATSAAVLLFIVNMVGLGFGPLLVGALSDVFGARLGEAEGLRWALAVSSAIGLMAAGCFFMARRTIGRDLVS